MPIQTLANQISSLNDIISGLITEIQYLRNDLEKTRENNDNLKFSVSELESALNR